MLRLLDNLTPTDFEEMAALEARAYSSDFIAPAGEAYAWYRRFPYTTVAFGVEDDGARGIAGFVNLFPVVDEVFEGLKAGSFNDAELVVEQIVDIEAAQATAEPLHMFLSCIAVDEKYRGQGVARALVRAAVAQYAGLAERFDWIVTDNVTPEGARLSERLGFSLVGESDHGSLIYLQDYAGFIGNL